MDQLAQGIVSTMTVAFTQVTFLMGSHQRPTTPEGDGASVKVTHPSTPAPHHLSDDRLLCTLLNHPVSHG